MTTAPQAIIEDLEQAIQGRNIADRATMLRRVTDLFVAASGQLSHEQTALFDDVMGRLLAEIDSSARATFGHLFATLADAPPGIVRSLALDDMIDVAGPVLAHSERVDDVTLVEGARTKSQAHLLAISRRRFLAESVTDILVERGDREVALNTAKNPGAAFSEFGYSTLVRRSSSDDDLALCVWARPEVPRQHLLKLFADATESVKLELSNRDPGKARLMQDIVTRASGEVQARAREMSAGYAAAYAQVRSLQAAGSLDELQLADFAKAGKFDETSIALSFLCDLPIAMIERSLVDGRSEQIIVIAKAAGLAWETVKAILQVQSRTPGGLALSYERSFETFARLKVETAKKAIQFYRLRERATLARLN